MHGWFLLLGGLVVWTVHFFSLYAIAETMGATGVGRMAVLTLTGLCLIANALIATMALRVVVAGDFTRWLRSVALLGAVLSGIAVAWQALPALI